MLWVSRTVQTSRGTRRAIVVSLDDDDSPGSQAQQQRMGGKPVAYDHHELAERVRAEPEPVHCVVLRGRGPDGSGQFRMTRDLDDEQLVDLGYQRACAQLEAWRGLLSGGLLAIARVELRVWELAALRSGSAKLVSELGAQSVQADPTRAEGARVGKWFLEQALLNFGSGLDTVLSEVLPARLVQLEESERRPATR